MTDISTYAPITVIRHLSLSRPRFPRLELRVSLREIFGLWTDAYNLVCMAPCTSVRHQPPAAPDEDLQGRDPTW